MPTRLYIQDAVPPISPAFSPSWNVTGSALRRTLTIAPQNSGNFSASANGGTVANQNVLIRQCVSSGIIGVVGGAGGLLSGTITGQILGTENIASADYSPQFVLRIFSANGLVQRGIAYGADDSALSHEFSPGGSFENRGFPRGSSANPLPINEVVCQPGDIVVAEFGLRNFNGVNSGCNLRITDNAGADLPQNETSTAQLNCWIELSADLASLPRYPNRGDITGRSKRPQPKGIMRDVDAVPFRRFAYDNSSIYKGRPIIK